MSSPYLPDQVEQERRQAYRDLPRGSRYSKCELEPSYEERMLAVYPEGDPRQDWLRRELARWRGNR